MTFLTQFNDGTGLRFWGPVLPLLALLLAGCDPVDDDDAPNFDRGAYLAHTADNIIVPAYTDFIQRSQTLSGTLNGLTAGTIDSKDIDAARDALHEAYMAWQRVQLFDFGPGQLRVACARVASVQQ